MSDPYGPPGPGDNQGRPDDDDVTPVDGTHVDWSDATHLKPVPPGPAYLGPPHATTSRLSRAPAEHVPGRRSLRAVVGDAVQSHRDAPVATRVTMQLIGLAILLVVSAGAMFLLLRDPGDSDLAAAPTASESGLGETTVPTTGPPTTAAPTTSTSTTTSTTTTVPPTTAAPATVPPATSPPTTVPPTTAPPTTTPPTTAPANQVRYDDCWDARQAGALPLYEGDPGYRARLDRDGDGEACNSWRDWH